MKLVIRFSLHHRTYTVNEEKCSMIKLYLILFIHHSVYQPTVIEQVLAAGTQI